MRRRIDVFAGGRQAVLAHPRFHPARGCELVATRMDHPPFDIAAAIERVHEIVEQSQLFRDGIFLRQAHEHHHTRFAG